MKLTKGKKIAMVCFAAFLAFMAVCTVVAKGIYASGLPRVATSKPYSGSLTHVIKVTGTVEQGQEYGIYVEAGLRVDTVSVGRGDIFQPGDALFRIDTGDLADIVARRRLEIGKLEVQMAEAVSEDKHDRQARRRAADRAREDYEKEAAEADARIRECQQALEAAQRALALYDQYLADSSRSVDSGENGGEVPDVGGAGTGSEPGEGTGSNHGSGNLPGETGAGAELNGGAENGGADGGAESGGNSGDIGADGSGNGGNAGPNGSESDKEADGGAKNRETEADGDTENRGAGADGSGKSEPGGRGEEAGVGEDRSSEDAPEDGNGWLHEVSSEVVDPAQQYSRQEKRLQLEQNVITAAQALEEAERQKAAGLRDAARVLEDAEAAVEAANAAVNTLALEVTYQKERLGKLEELLEADGWVYAEASGRVTDNRLSVGERTQDGAGILYALDDGERIVSAAFSVEEGRYVSVGTQFEIKAVMPDGSRASGTALLDYMEKGADGAVHARLSFDLPDMAIGQSVELAYRMQTDSYSICISRNCLRQEGEDRHFVYIVEEQEGILGTEWKVRKVGIQIIDQNDTVAAIQSADITGDTRIVSGTNKQFTDGDTVRVVQ